MKKPNIVGRIVVATLVVLVMVAILVAVSWGHPVPVLQTHGIIANRERDLIYITAAMSALVVVPVFSMLFFIVWRYRASNTKARYEPNYNHDRRFEALWWGIPCLIIIVLAVITAVSTHELDPYRPIQSSVKPLNIQVVALQWRWLFIYPDQGTASLGTMVIPENTPINLSITSDAPMNSFWVPALAGQIYAMSGMSTQLHLMANTTGTFMGSSANISGDGFADMRIKVQSVTLHDFTAWAQQAARSNNMLTAKAYKTLARPSTDEMPETFMLMDKNLYNEIIVSTMGTPPTTAESSTTAKTSRGQAMSAMKGMDMSGMGQ